MSDDEVWALVLAIIGEVDYDHWKEFQPHLCEEPDELPRQREALINTARKYLKGESNE